MGQRYPNLIHPIQIEIEQIIPGETFYDPDTREPIQQAARSETVVVPGQPRIRSGDELNIVSRGGNRPESEGYILFRKVDLDARGIVLNINDRITKIGHLEQQLYITRLEWIGQLQDYNGPTLVKAWYEDRRPSKYPSYAN